jgi:hypothetical protein
MSDDDVEDLLYLLEDGKPVKYLDPARGTVHTIFALRSHYVCVGRRQEEPAIKIEDGKWIPISDARRSAFVLVVPALEPVQVPPTTASS